MERRNEDDDRRKIERITNPAMRSVLVQIQLCLRYLIVLGGALALFVLVTGVIQGSPEDLMSSLFVLTIFGLLVIIFFRYHSAIDFYIKNESSANLDRTMESQSVAWIAISFMATFSAITYFLFSN